MKLNGMWFPQIVDRDRLNLYIQYIQKMVVLASEPVGGRSRVTELPCYDLLRLGEHFLYGFLTLFFSDTRKTDSRREALMKWKREKELKDKLAREKLRKPVFKVSVSIDSKLKKLPKVCTTYF